MLSFADFVWLVVVDKMNLLKQTIEQQRQRRSNSNSKENSFDDKLEAEQKVDHHNTDETSHTSNFPQSDDKDGMNTVKQDQSKLTCNFDCHLDCNIAYELPTSGTDNRVTSVDTAYDETNTLTDLEPAATRVRHISSDPVIKGSEKFASLLNVEIPQKVLPRKIALVDETGIALVFSL